MFIPGKRYEAGRPRGRRAARLLLGLLAPLGLAAAAGCGMWDDFRAVDYSFKAYFSPDEPLAVLADEKATPDQKARALSRLREPAQEGKTDAQHQEYAVAVLTRIATEDPQALCRMRAIEALSRFKDPRAPEALARAYYKAEDFTPDNRKVIRVQAMTALGKLGDPKSVELLVGVLEAPQLDSTKTAEDDKQHNLDERLAAARALENFKDYRATEALVKAMKTTRDPGLQNRANESLAAITGKKLPPDAVAWEEYLSNPQEPKPGTRLADRVKLGQPVTRTKHEESSKSEARNPKQ